GIFQSTKFAFPGTEIYRHPKDFVALASGSKMTEVADYQKELSELDDEIEKLGEQKRQLVGKLTKDEAEELKKPDKKDQLDAEEAKLRDQLKDVKADLEDARSKQRRLEAEPPDVEKAYGVTEGTPTNVKIQKRGDPFNPGDEAPRGFLTILGGEKLPSTEKGSGRLELAQWLTSPKNPLTARVMANRIWEYHF